jgi:hypothetical protein
MCSRLFIFSLPVLLSVFFFSAPLVARAATCSIVSDTVIDQAYVDDNGCTSIDINASVSTTWIGVTNLGGGTVTVASGVTMTMGTSSAMILGAADDLIVNGRIAHASSSVSGIDITVRNLTVSSDGVIDASGMGCPGGAPAEDGSGPANTDDPLADHACVQSVGGVRDGE